jgi:hypothetical protein
LKETSDEHLRRRRRPRIFRHTWPAKDRAAAESLVADDFTFTSPLDNRLNRTTFFARCWPNSDTTASLEITRLVPDDELVSPGGFIDKL